MPDDKDKKDSTTKKGGELKGKDSTKQDQDSRTEQSTTGFDDVMRLLMTMMQNAPRNEYTPTSDAMKATQIANARVNAGPFGGPNPARTEAINDRRREMNVVSHRGRTKAQMERDKASREKTKRRNKDKKFARLDRDMTRLEEQLAQDRKDVEALVAETRAAEAEAEARRNTPPVLPQPVEDEVYGGGQGSEIIESPVPEQAPEPAAPAPAPTLAPAPAQAPPVQQELGPNPLQAVVYANYPSMRPNPGPFSTDQRGGGPYADTLPPPTPYNPPGFEESGLGPAPAPYLPTVTHYGQATPGTLPTPLLPAPVGMPHDSGYGAQNQPMYQEGSDARGAYIQDQYDAAGQAQRERRLVERFDDNNALNAAPPASPPGAMTGGVPGYNYADFDDATARQGHDPSLTEANLRQRMGYPPAGGVPAPQYGGVMDTVGGYLTGAQANPMIGVRGLTPEEAANPLAMMPVDRQGNRRPFTVNDSNRGFFGPNPLQRLGHFFGFGDGRPIMVDPYSHGYTVGSYPR